MKTANKKTAKKTANKKTGVMISTEKKKQRIEYNALITTNAAAKEYEKDFKGVRTILLGGANDTKEDGKKFIVLTSFEKKMLNATKSNKFEKLFKYILANGKTEANYTRKDGVKVQFSHYTKWSVLGVLRKIANSDVLLRELEYKF